jgi:hypothetical protein
MICAVRYLRMLTNAVAGGVLVAMYLVVLVLQLNPQLPVVSITALRWFGVLLAFYGLYLSVALYFLILILDAVSPQPLRPAWFSVRVLAWLGAGGAAAAAILTWSNLDGFRAVLSDSAAESMRLGATATTVSAAVLVTVAVFRYSFGRKGSRAAGVLLIVAMVLSVAVPLWVRGPGETSVPVVRQWAPRQRIVAPTRVRLLVFDGASLGFIRQRVAAGQLPNFGRLLDRGATIDLATLRPTQAVPVWTAAATGKSPERTGVRSSDVYRVSPNDQVAVDLLPDYCFAYALVSQGFIAASPLTSAAVNGRPMWRILADYGLASGITGWPLTYPASADLGYVLSDRFDEAASSPLRLADARAGDPTTAVDVARETFDRWLAIAWPDVLPASAPDEPEPLDFNAARWDRAYSDTAAELEQQFAPRLTAVRYEALDAFGRRYLRHAQPELFGDPRRADPRRSILDRHYAYLDGEVGRIARLLAPGDLLVVVSGFGMERMTPVKRLLARLKGQADLTGTPESAPDGFLMAYGTNAARGQFPRGSIGDLAPTVLYYMGVPVGRDMDGFARTDLFTTTYTLDHPVKYVATHER